MRVLLGVVLLGAAACGRCSFDVDPEADRDTGPAPDATGMEAGTDVDARIPIDSGPWLTDAGGGEVVVTWGFDSPSDYKHDPGAVVFERSLLLLARVSQRDDELLGEFAEGTLTDLRWSEALEGIEVGGANSGVFTSRVFDAGGVVDWATLSWKPQRPSGKPVRALDEAGYAQGNLGAARLRLLVHFDDAADAVVDSSPLAHVGANSGGTWVTDGVFSRALSLGVNEYVDFGSPPELTIQTDLTVMTWVRRRVSADGIWHFIVSKESDPVGSGWCLYFDDNERLVFCVGEGSILDTITSTSFVETGRWLHVAATHRNGLQRIYVDGVEQPLRQGGAHAVELGLSAHPLEFGRRYSNDRHLRGDVDETVIYERVLSASEIREAYLRGATRIGLQVRSCDTADCAGRPFVGPGGSPTSFFTEVLNTEAGPPELALDAMSAPPARYFQYRAELSRLGTDSPVLDAVGVSPQHVFAGRTAVETHEGIAFRELRGFSQTLALEHTATLGYQLSSDGMSWYYVAGDRWEPAGSLADISTAAEIDAAAEAFAAAAGEGLLRVRVVLESRLGVQLSEVDAIQVRVVP